MQVRGQENRRGGSRNLGSGGKKFLQHGLVCRSSRKAWSPGCIF
jgi:hypothetical protein